MEFIVRSLLDSRVCSAQARFRRGLGSAPPIASQDMIGRGFIPAPALFFADLYSFLSHTIWTQWATMMSRMDRSLRTKLTVEIGQE